mgnify:CR=1 FL=1
MARETTESSKPIACGMVGTGTVAGQWASQVSSVSGAVAYAVASRSESRAQTFAQKHGITKAFEGVDAMCADPAVDVVYVATPTHTHVEVGRAVLAAGKGLVCEKPFGRSRAEAQALIDDAREADLFCMEAMWMRFNPLVQKVRRALKDGKIGEPKTVTASLGYQKPSASLGRAADGRGALLAFGCYGLSLALYLFGTPSQVQWAWTPNPQGGDETAMLTICYDEHLMTFTCSERATLTNKVRIQGTDGHLQLNGPFIDATELEIVTLSELGQRSVWERVQGRIEQVIGPILGSPSRGRFRATTERLSGFRGEVKAVTACVQNGMVESEIMPWTDTLAVHEILDAATASPSGTWTPEAADGAVTTEEQ